MWRPSRSRRLARTLRTDLGDGIEVTELKSTLGDATPLFASCCRPTFQRFVARGV